MKNLSGDASRWHTSPTDEIPRKKNEQPRKGPVPPPSYSNEVAEIEPILKKLREKYDAFPTKNAYDAIVDLESAIRALKN